MADYDHIYLSPHFDDVALSCGGRVFLQTAAGESVLVVTVTAADPPADVQSATVAAIHRRWVESLAGAPVESTIVGRRRAEDRAAFAILGAAVLHLPFLDCIYRTRPDGRPFYPGPTDMFGDLDAGDRGIIEALAGAFAALPSGDRVYAPLGVGHHIDHQITRLAAERTFADLIYYEEYPYTMQPGAMEAVLPQAKRDGWSEEIVQLTPAAITAKIEAVAAYQSQLSSFFTGYDDVAHQLREEGQRVLAGSPAGGERFWRRLSR